eukprot:3684872-Alexandrium_andersonii.AAC.1
MLHIRPSCPLVCLLPPLPLVPRTRVACRLASAAMLLCRCLVLHSWDAGCLALVGYDCATGLALQTMITSHPGAADGCLLYTSDAADDM